MQYSTDMKGRRQINRSLLPSLSHTHTHNKCATTFLQNNACQCLSVCVYTNLEARSLAVVLLIKDEYTLIQSTLSQSPSRNAHSEVVMLCVCVSVQEVPVVAWSQTVR